MMWTTPKTDWVGMDRCTASDMNRICGNLNFLHDFGLPTAWTSNDMVTAAQWGAITSAAETLARSLAIDTVAPSHEVIDQNSLNITETITLKAKIKTDQISDQFKHYAGEGNYTGDFYV